MTRDACHAGTMLKPTPVSTESRKAKARTREIDARRGACRRARWAPAWPAPSCRAAPAQRRARRRRGRSACLRPSSARSGVPRLAPSAERTAISRRRRTPRASSRPARLAQAISSTQPAAPIRTSSSIRVLPTISSRSGTTTAPILCRCRETRDCKLPADRAHLLAGPRQGDAGLQARDHIQVVRAVIRPGRPAEKWIGTQKSMSRLRKAKSRGMTPMIEYFRPLIRMSRFTAPGAPA